MQAHKRTMRSAYMEWVKTETGSAAFNLANSGVKSYSLSDLAFDFASFELSGPGAYGYAPLVERNRCKMRCAPECVVTAQGTSMANHLAMAALIEPGDEVLIEHPGYPLFWETAEYLGRNVKFLRRSDARHFAIDLDELQRSITPATRLIVISNLHNPSCALTSEDSLREIGGVARAAGAKVLVDEVYLDLLFDRAPQTSFKLDPVFVVTNSLTKVYGLSGLRCGWILAEPSLVKRIYLMNDLFGVNNPYVTDQMSCAALKQLDHIAKWSRDLLARNRALAAEFLTSTPQLEGELPEAGTVLFPRLNVDVAQFCRELCERYDTIVTPGHFFGSPDRIRIGIGGDTAVLAQGLSRIRAALSSYLSTHTERRSAAQPTAGLA